MALPKIIYDAGAGDVTLLFKRGPQGFQCTTQTRANDNLATSGLRERVLEGHDLLISFVMPALVVGDDLGDWSAFMRWALGGGNFKLYLDAGADPGDYYTCTCEQKVFESQWQGPARYAASFDFRIVPDAQAPADDGAVMERFYGVSA